MNLEGSTESAGEVGLALGLRQERFGRYYCEQSDYVQLVQLRPLRVKAQIQNYR